MIDYASLCWQCVCEDVCELKKQATKVVVCDNFMVDQGLKILELAAENVKLNQEVQELRQRLQEYDGTSSD